MIPWRCPYCRWPMRLVTWRSPVSFDYACHRHADPVFFGIAHWLFERGS